MADKLIYKPPMILHKITPFVAVAISGRNAWTINLMNHPKFNKNPKSCERRLFNDNRLFSL